MLDLCSAFERSIITVNSTMVLTFLFRKQEGAMWIILSFLKICMSALSCRPSKLFPELSLATCLLYYIHVLFVQTRGHSDSGNEWIEKYVWDKQKQNDFVAHLSTSSSHDEVTRAITELDVSVDSALFVAKILSAAECMTKF